MLTQLSKLLVLTGILTAFSCGQSVYKEDTEILKNYLETYIHKSIPKDTMYYVIISEYGCEGCIGKTVTKLKDNKKALFIVNDNTYFKYILPKNVSADKYVIDSSNTIKRLKFHQHNVGIVQTANAEIYNIIYIAYNEADSSLSKIE